MTILNASLVALTTWIRRKKCDESEFCDRILPEVMKQTGWKVSNQPSPLSGHIKSVKKGGKYFYFSRLECNQVSKYSYLRSFLKEGPSSRYLSRKFWYEKVSLQFSCYWFSITWEVRTAMFTMALYTWYEQTSFLFLSYFKHFVFSIFLILWVFLSLSIYCSSLKVQAFSQRFAFQKKNVTIFPLKLNWYWYEYFT